MLDNYLKRIEQTNPDALPGLVHGVKGYPRLRKLKIGGRLRLRPLLCKGPCDMDNEITLLIGAIEKDWEFIPVNAREMADARRLEILQDPTRRRRYFSDSDTD